MRSYVKLSITGDYKGFLYFMYADERVPVPTFKGV